MLKVVVIVATLLLFDDTAGDSTDSSEIFGVSKLVGELDGPDEWELADGVVSSAPFPSGLWLGLVLSLSSSAGSVGDGTVGGAELVWLWLGDVFSEPPPMIPDMILLIEGIIERPMSCEKLGSD